VGGAVIRLRAPHPDQVRSAEWRERGVTITEVIQQVARHHAQLARHDAADESMPHPRNCCLNLVAVAEGKEQVRQAEQVGHALAAHHPLRQLVIELEPPGGIERMDAWLLSEAHPTAEGMPVQFERVRLKVSGPGLAAIDSLVAPLLVPEVPTCLWWLGTPPIAEEPFRRALELCDLLAVDSATFEQPFLTTLELAGLAGDVGPRLAIADFHWARLQPWREIVAQFFQPAERRPFLRGLNAVGVDYVGEARGNRVAATLTVGWLASALDWKLKRAAAGTGGAAAAFYGAPRGHPVEVHLRSLPSARLAEGEVSAVRIDAMAGGHACALAVERSEDHPDHVDLRIDIGEVETLRQRLPMDAPGPAELLVEMLTARRDPVYLRALAAAAELLKAFL
jgi:glucose-6-phosphate dehydrogenase assembly protein OpcA